MMNLVAIQQRFDARAAAALEVLIEEVEASGLVRAMVLEVLLVPDGDHDGNSRTVEVNLTLELARPSVRLTRQAGRPGLPQFGSHPEAH